MLNKMYEFVEANSGEILVTGGITNSKIKELEDILDVKFREEIVEYLLKCGIIMGYGVEFLGCGKSAEASLVKETLRFRKFGLSKEYIVIRNVDEWIYCINNTNGYVTSWDRNSQAHLVKSNSFEQYIYDELIQAQEEWN